MFANRHRQQNLGVWLLAYQLLTLNDRLPPVTLFAILGQAAIFLRLIPALSFSVGDVCLSPYYIFHYHQWWRLLLAPLFHADDMHLYYNMLSFMWKGRRLERRFGSVYFAYLIVVFTALTSGCLVGVSLFAEDVLHLHHYDLMRQCAVGFSGVIFALKVLCNAYFPEGDSWLFGMFPVPSRYACWAELLLIQFLVPNASFVGHLAGILVGLAYTSGPLKAIMDMFVDDESAGARRTYRRPSSAGGGRRFWGGGTLGGDPYRRQTFDEYTAGLSEEEQLRRATQESLRSRTRPTAPPYPD